ncbi:hypothetical protein V8C35DRAFT_200512 [Trichoderma chlorosporum]
MSSPEEHSTTNSRRIRSRIAQQAYRKRHKEKFHSSQRRAQDLQVAAQRACTVFTDLTNVLIRSGVIQNDAALTLEVFNAIKKFHHVAKIVDEDSQHSGPADVDQVIEYDAETPNLTAPVRSDGQVHENMTNDVPPDLYNIQTVPRSGDEAVFPQDQFNHFVYPPASSNQILISPSYFALEFAINGDPSSIGSRLLRTTLSSGYEALKGNSGHATELGHRIFGLTLSYRNRDDVLSEFQWWLGPGQPLASRLKQARNYPGVPTSETYLSVEDVVIMLRDVGVINIQDDVLELPKQTKLFNGTETNSRFESLADFEYDASNTDAYSPPSGSIFHSESAWRNVPALQAFNFNSLMGNLTQEEDREKESLARAFPELKKNQRRSVPVSVLLQGLANISVCLSIGPGYPQQAVKSLIYEIMSGISMR